MTRRDVAAFLGLAALWGTAFVATKAALASISPIVLAAVRFDVAALCLFGAVLVSGHDWRPTDAGDWRPILTGGVFNIGFHHILLFTGQQYVTPAVASTLLGLVPVLTPAATRVLRPDERLPIRGVVGVLVGFVGVLLIANPSLGNLGASVGVGLVLGSAIAWVVGSVLTQENQATLPGLALQSWMLLVGAVTLHLAVLIVPGEELATLATATPAALGWLVYLAVVPGAIGFLLFFRLLDRLGPIQMGLLEYAIPPFAALFGWFILGDALAPRTVFGFFAILLGFALVKAEPLRAAARRRFG